MAIDPIDSETAQIDVDELADKFRRLPRKDQRDFIAACRELADRVDRGELDAPGGMVAGLRTAAAFGDLLAESPDFHRCDSCSTSFPSEPAFRRHQRWQGKGKARRLVCR